MLLCKTEKGSNEIRERRRSVQVAVLATERGGEGMMMMMKTKKKEVAVKEAI